MCDSSMREAAKAPAPVGSGRNLLAGGNAMAYRRRVVLTFSLPSRPARPALVTNIGDIDIQALPAEQDL